MIDKDRWRDELNPDTERSAWTVTLCALGAAIVMACALIGCVPPSVTPTHPTMVALDVRLCGDAEVAVNGIAKRPDPDLVARFTVDESKSLEVVYKAPGDSVGITHLYALGGGPHQILVGDCLPLTVPGFQVRFELPFTPLPRIARDGKFISVGGQPYFGLGASSYALLELYIHDRPAFTAVVAELHDLGFNEVRVWTLADVDFSQPRGGHLHIIPSELPDFYTQTRQMVRELARAGLYVELTAFTGTSRLMPNLADQQAHLDALVEIARSETNVMIEVGNEYDQGDNQWKAWDLVYPTDILISGGSVGSDNWPSEYGLPTLQYLLWHGNDAPQWWRKMPHEPWELGGFYKAPARVNETTKADDAMAGADGNLAGPRLYGAFQGCKLLNDGCTFHSRDGRMSRLLSPEIKALAQQAVAGANSLELRCRRIDQYVHRDDLEGPNQSLWLRVYQQGSDAKCIAYVPN